MSALAEAAAFLAQTWPVFPCNAQKRPMTENGLYAATRDADAARAMCRNAVLLGVPTGSDSDLAVWDFDTKHDGAGLTWLADNEHRIPRTRRHRTPSGGIHLLFRYPAGVNFRNTQGYLHAKTGKLVGIALGVDTRGEGGYICAPPSPGYQILDDTMPAEMPAWMIELYLSRKPPPPATTEPYAPPSRREIPARYAEKALVDECSIVAGTMEGGRNAQLNISAVKLGSLVAVGAIPETVARAELRRAALHAGLDPRETDATIQSGLTYGMQHPRELPERQLTRRIIEEYAPPPSPPDWVYEEAAGLEPEAEPAPPTPRAEAPQREPSPGLPLIYWNDVAPSLGADDFVEGVLIAGQMSVIYGPSNCGKTFWTSDLAMHVATGRKWNGRDIEPGGVIYCALEGAYGIQNRVTAWRRHNGLEGVEVPFAIIPVALNLLDPAADTDRVIDAIQTAAREMAVPVKWIIMDTLSRAMAGGNENSPEDMGALVTNGTKIQQIGKCHVSWIHHSGKDQAQGARGHSLLRAATDTEIEISRPDKDSPSTAKVTKQREMEIEGEWTFKLQTVELGQNRRGKAVTSCVVLPAERGVTSDKLKLSPGAQYGLAALREAVIAGGKAPVTRDIPTWARVVTLDAWRTEFYRRSHLDSNDAKRQAFHRAIKDLRAAERVGVLNEMVWITDAE